MSRVSTKNAPEAIGPYSQAVIKGDYVFCSGQIALTPDGILDGKNIIEQTNRVIRNLEAVLEAAGSSLSNVLKTTVYLADMRDFEKMNAEYEKFFKGSKPARATVQVSGLPKGALIEIDCIASL